MPALESIWRMFPALSIPVFALALTLLVFSIVRVIRIVRAAVIVRVPLVPEQRVGFPEPGAVVLAAEGPRFSRAFARLHYTLEDEQGVPGRGTLRLFRATTSGVSTVRLELRNFYLPHAGPYTLRVQGLDDPAGRPGHFLVFTRPHLLDTVACIAAITLAAGLAIASFVLTLIWLLGPAAA